MKNNHIKSLLDQIGLTDKESTVYLECLKHDELSPFQISKITSIPRTSVYDILMSLSLKKLIELQQSDGFTKQQTRVRAKNPSVLRKILQQKRKSLQLLELDLMHVLPQLKADFHQGKHEGNVQVFSGIEGAKKVYQLDAEDSIDLESYSWDYLLEMDVFGLEFQNSLIKKRTAIRKKMHHKRKTILPLNDWTIDCFQYQLKQDTSYFSATEYRIIDKPFFTINQVMIIKGNTIKIISVKQKEIWGVIITSHLLAQTWTSIFLQSWSIATPLTKKLISSWKKGHHEHRPIHQGNK